MISDFPYKILRKNHATGTPRDVLYLDTETRTVEKGEYIAHHMKLAWSCRARYDNKGDIKNIAWREWFDVQSMWSYIFSQARQKSTLYLFAHNAFFDLQASEFFYYAQKWGWTHEFNWEEGLTFILVVKKGDRRLKILSTTNFFDVPLEKIGKLLGYEKGKVDFDTVSDEDLSEYCKRDVEIVKRIMELYFSFIREHDLGKFSMTRASQSFRAFRHRFMQNKICLHHHPQLSVLERAAYHGGRVECFSWRNQKKGPFVTYDVNSMYPYIMRENFVPIQAIDYLENVPIKRVKRLVKFFAVVAEVELQTDIPIYAVKQDEKLIFPVGNFIAYLCTPGMIEALKRNHVVRIHKLIYYKRAMLFDTFVDYFYGMKARYKQQGNEVFEWFTKYFLNSLYGKFGQKKTITLEYQSKTVSGYYKQKSFDLDKGKWVDEYELLGKHFIKIGFDEAPNAFVAIAAHITEGARIYLWHLFEKVGPDKVLYCDTDSLMIRARDAEPLKSFKDKYRLGYLDIKSKSKRLDLRGAKSYKTDHEIKMKGVPRNAEKVGDFQFKYFTFHKQTTHLKKGISRYFLTKETIKDVTPRYDKGVITSQGKIVPFRLQSPGRPLSLPPLPLTSFARLEGELPGVSSENQQPP